MSVNPNMVLVVGKSISGKTASLRGLQNQEGVMYLNCEAGKELPFAHSFQAHTISDPFQVYEAFLEAENQPQTHTIVVDTLTFLMDMFESNNVLTSTDTQKAWGDYAQFFKRLMQKYASVSTKNIIIMAHASDIVNADKVREVAVKVKGSLMANGIESMFSTVVSAKCLTVKELEGYESDLLTITEDEKIDGFKHIFQTKRTKETANERIRASIGMWTRKETYIDNNVEHVLNRLVQYHT
jgi:hypothetical protein